MNHMQLIKKGKISKNKSQWLIKTDGGQGERCIQTIVCLMFDAFVLCKHYFLFKTFNPIWNLIARHFIKTCLALKESTCYVCSTAQVERSHLSSDSLSNDSFTATSMQSLLTTTWLSHIELIWFHLFSIKDLFLSFLESSLYCFDLLLSWQHIKPFILLLL